uniref:HNH domain-containing protein n=1 Tax=Salix viminalis TaxID=40686 RepID=A0A6N2MAP4_SALVM
MESRYTQIEGGGRACVYNIRDYDVVLTCLKNCKGVEIEKIPFSTLNIIQRLSKSFDAGRWEPCRPEHFTDEKVDEFIRMLPRKLLDALLPFQLHGLRFGSLGILMHNACQIFPFSSMNDAIAIAGCFINEGPILVVCQLFCGFHGRRVRAMDALLFTSEIHLVFGHRNNPVHLTRCPKVVVISYTMLHHLRKAMLEQEWALLIVDESHHVRCSKNKSEPNEAWFAGQNKYDFAKLTVLLELSALMKQKVFSIGNLEENERDKDFSKGIRLEELNVLLRQTVMQVGVVAIQETLLPRAWIAKLSGFVNGFPFILSFQTEFVCEKGVGFVRIDGNTLASDRQNAVSSFQSSDKACTCSFVVALCICFATIWHSTYSFARDLGFQFLLGDALQGCSETDFYGHFRDVGIVLMLICDEIGGRMLDKLANNPCEGNAWHADHIVPVYHGGGECKLENMRTLCVACHSKVTAAQRAERCSTREKARKQLEVIMNDMKYMEETATNVKGKQEKAPNDMGKGLTFSDKFSPKDQQINVGDPSGQGHSRMREEDLVDELLVKVPGSAYSGGLSADPESEELKKSSNEEGCEAHAPVGFSPHALFGRRVRTHTMVGNGRSSWFSKRLRVAFLPRWRVSPKNACGRAVGRLKALPPFSLSPARESAGESPMCCAFSLWSFYF